MHHLLTGVTALFFMATVVPQPAQQGFSFLTAVDGVYQSQIVAEADGTMVLIWAQDGTDGLDLFASHRGQGGAFTTTVQLNRLPLNSYTGDEARPSVAIDPGGQIAVAWTGENFDLQVAIGRAHATQFDEPLRLNQDGGRGTRTMPAIAFAPDGAVHAVWLDARRAPPRREEPSDLFHARVEDGKVAERNLTAHQEASVCGCCRPFIEIDATGAIDIAFRNTTPAGYRDIFRIRGDSKGEFGSPEPTSPPIWRVMGCPSVGPVVSQGATLWKDASDGAWRLLSASNPDVQPDVVLADREGLTLTYAPRKVSTANGTTDLVLVGGMPTGFILRRSESGWQTLAVDLPEWASSAALEGDHLVLVGDDEGRFQAESRQVDWGTGR